MKRIIALVILFAIILSLTACGSKNNSQDELLNQILSQNEAMQKQLDELKNNTTDKSEIETSDSVTESEITTGESTEPSTTQAPTQPTTQQSATQSPTNAPSTTQPPTTQRPTTAPSTTQTPTKQPTTAAPTQPTTQQPTTQRATNAPTSPTSKNIYVSPTGNDSTATGSVDKPYKSINTALAAAEPGYTIILRGGTYREGENVRVRIPNITIKSAEGEWAVIDLTTHNRGCDEDSGVYFDVDSSGGKLQNVEVTGGFYAVCMETTFRWDPADPFTYGASNIIIDNCKLHDSKYDVVKVKPNCNNITIRNNEIYNSGRAEINKPYWLEGEANAEGIDNVNGDNMSVQNNYIHDIGGNGIYAKGGATDALIENNRIERIYGGGILVGFDTSPEWFDIKVNPQYHENIRCIVRNNLIIDTGWEGIGFYGSKDAQVYNNTLVNVDNGGLYHSAIYFGLTYQDWESYAGRPATINPNIHHNIICQPTSFNRQMIEIRYSEDLDGMSALSGKPVMNNNCYYIAGKKASFTDNRPGSILENAGFSAWQSHISGDNGSIEADPVLNVDYMPTNAQCAGIGITK